MFFKLMKLGVKWVVVMVAIMFCTICCGSLLLLSYISPKDTREDDIARLLYRDNPGLVRQTQGYHGLFKGYEGWDYTTFCGDTLYSPLPGRGVVTYNGLDGYSHAGRYEQNTMIKIEGAAGKVILLHGDYSKVHVGDEVIGGVTPIGINASIGYSTGCHTHLVWQPNLDYIPNTYTERRFTSYENVGIRVSNYIPSQGGINCDSDCSTMASGDKVADWLLGKNGIRAAACPREFPFRTRIMIEGQVYECVDRGSYIQEYVIGEYDPAMKAIATKDYFWIDILGNTGFGYGEITYNWKFIN